ncbi:hypothetical protein [Limnobacter parvus]|uniref:BapA prefix-like domain-containing protein n=1 Tax=Limnobacter parvus TaxID=2939690 RepID=A0ABT1XKR7_9BURK|nr:hypothetical protein [Limnobacter parvus]MCR2747897.1 hypothetical protein [Limnobacter parvus]
MNFDSPVVASVANIDGDVFVKRNGVEVPLQEDMVLQAGDVLRSTSNSIAVVSIPGTNQQIPAFLEISNGGEATLGFDPDAGMNGQVVIASNAGDGLGNVTLVSEFDGENQAAVLDGEEPSGEMSGLFGAGLLGAGAGISALPVAGAVGAAALFVGSDDDNNSGAPGSADPGALPAENAGGLAETVSDLTNNLTELTEPVPVVGDVVGAVGGVLESTLVGNNNGGLNGILSGVTDGLTNGLDGTPLAPVADVLDMGLGALTDLLGMAADQVSGLGEGTPLAPVSNLIGDLLGTSGPNTDGGVGGVVGTLVNVTDSVGQLLEPIPVLGDIASALGGVVDSVATGNNEGGLGGILTGLGGGLEASLSSTPLALIGEGGSTLLNTVGGLLGGVGDAVSSVGGNTPAAPLTNLIGDLAGSLGGDVDSALANIPFLGEALDGLTGGLGGGFGGVPGDIPLLSDLLDGGLLSSISTTGSSGGGLLGGLPLLGDLTNTLG